MHGTYSKGEEKELSLACRVGAAASRTATEAAKKQGATRPTKERRKKESLGEKKERACREGFCRSRSSSRRRCSNWSRQPARDNSRRQEQQLLAGAPAATGAADTSGEKPHHTRIRATARAAAVGRSSSCGQERQERQPSTRAAAVGRSSSHQIQKSLEIRDPGRRGFTHEKLYVNNLGGPSIYTHKDSFHTRI
jgi:hypothetical protein